MIGISALGVWQAPCRSGEDVCCPDDFGHDMGSYPRSDYSMKAVKRAGEVIAGDLLWTEENAPVIREAFQIANNWRDAHAYPMRSMRAQLISFMRKNNLEGVTAARLKRMQAIRRKLRRPDLPHNLSQLQDLGGCRAILPSIADVHTLLDVLRSRSRHELWREDPYIAEPKDDGYRSHHLRYKFRGKGAASVHDGRRIEVQVRTRLQHSWATAVEAVGLFRGENLKGHQGSADWLELFKLMSAEFALAESCPEPPGIPSRHIRIGQIKELDRLLRATDTLDSFSHVVRWTDMAINPTNKPRYYLIQFDNATKQVNVEPYWHPEDAAAAYDKAETRDNEADEESKNVVLVEADKVENLKDAYPNYFGDVQLFKMQLRIIVKGKTAREYTVRPQETVAPRPRENPDLSWLRRRIRRWF